MKKRIFVAINLCEELKKELVSFQRKWPKLPCKWVAQNNLHLTLVFLGNLSEQEVLDVIEGMKQITKRYEPFSISFGTICYGPPKRIPPSLIWIEGEKSEQFSELKKDLDNLLAGKINFIPEKREFLPHITLGRIRKFKWRRLNFANRLAIKQKVSFNVPIESIEVMESHLKRSGAKYRALKSISLDN